jgi:anti-anti-sigma factor
MTSLPSSNDDLNYCPVCTQALQLDADDPPGDVPCPHCGHLLWFVGKPVGDVVVLTFLPGLMSGSESAGRLEEVLAAVGDSNRLVVNLAHLRFVSSLFLGMLVSLHRRLQDGQGGLKICGLTDGAADVLRTTRMDSFLSIFPDERSALDAF